MSKFHLQCLCSQQRMQKCRIPKAGPFSSHPKKKRRFWVSLSPGIDEQGLYRIAGVNSKVQKLLSLTMGKHQNTQSKAHVLLTLILCLISNPCSFCPLDPKTCADVELDSPEWEIKTITSAIKHYLRFVCLSFNPSPFCFNKRKVL